MSLATRLGIAPFLVFGLVACDDVVGEPITGPSDSDSGSEIDAGATNDPQDTCTLPERPLACTAIEECSNYPDAVCGQDGFCVCPSSDASAEPDTDAGGSDASCDEPPQGLSCMRTEDCGNYPGAVCGQDNFCACP